MTRYPGTLDQYISDTAIMPRDFDASFDFYANKLGFTVQHRMPSFADFAAPGVRFALWAQKHFAEHAGLPVVEAPSSMASMIAVHVETMADVDAWYERLTVAGVEVSVPPRRHEAWNAYCLYFLGPDGEVWEIYAWLEGGEPGNVEKGEARTE